MNTGRNQPCPCGSGRKYKHCCLLAQQSVAPDERVWRQVQRACESLYALLFKASERQLGPRTVDDAWKDFWPDAVGEPFDPRSPHLSVFQTWFFFYWQPSPDRYAGVAAKPVARALLETAANRLEPMQRRYVEACLATRHSFHEVLSVQPGRSMRLFDLLRGTEVDVIEKSASTFLRPNDVLLATVAIVDGHGLLEGCSALAFPATSKIAIIDLRKRLRGAASTAAAPFIDTDELRSGDGELRRVYLELMETALPAIRPTFSNTDGNSFEPQTLSWDLESPEAALTALAGLDKADVGTNVERSANGALVRAWLHWSSVGNPIHQHWDNTILGRLQIAGGQLIADVNSAERAAKLRTLVRERLGKDAKERPVVLHSVDAVVNDIRAQQAQEALTNADLDQVLREHTEVLVQFNDMMRKHYESWIDDPLPALGNQSPRQAVRTPDGREKVAALIADFERRNQRAKPRIDPSILRSVRASLGL